ncbi:hypothetical protein ACPPVO_24555 [Dactylosporangium sp. McL0621]|uniref:hypothetical protein n=1 Tax=Dactylosporangium sp. McL0621 TaxID=3415678 RepID=UPI003CEF8103
MALTWVMAAIAGLAAGPVLLVPTPAVAEVPVAAAGSDTRSDSSSISGSLLCVAILATAGLWALAKRRKALRDAAVPRPAAATPDETGTGSDPSPIPEGSGTGPAQRPADPDQYPATPLDTTLGSKRLRADSNRIELGGRRLAWGQVESVAYWVTRRHTAHGVFTSGNGSQWVFAVRGSGEEVVVRLDRWKTKAADDPVWSPLVGLSRRYLEPRLIADIAGRVSAGEAVAVTGGESGWLTVHPGGLRGKGGHPLSPVELSWPQFGGVSSSGGWLWVFRAGVDQPVMQIPVQQPNAVLAPALLTALYRQIGR